MPKIDPKLKERLKNAGKWGDFVKYRETLKNSGYTKMEAHKKAMARFFDNPPELVRGKPSIAPDDCQVKPPEADAPPMPPGAEGSDVDGEGAGTRSLPEAPSPPTPLPAAPPEPTIKNYTGDLPALRRVKKNQFEGKKCSEVEAVRWVADNMELEDPDPADCPSAAAWGMLSQCRNSAMFKSEFWRHTFTKLLPSKAQIDKEENTVPDESLAMGVIEDLLVIKKEAEDQDPTVSISGGIVGDVPESVTTSTEFSPTWREGEF